MLGSRITGLLLLGGVIVLWVASSELTKVIFSSDSFNKPFFLTYVDASSFTLFLYGAACFRSWRHVWRPRASSPSTLQSDNETAPLFPTLRPAAIFAVLWFAANYTFNLSLSKTSVASNTMLSSTSGVFTFAMNAVAPGPGRDTLNWPLKLVFVGGTLGGVALVSYADSESQAGSNSTDSLAGDMLAIGSAALYGVYVIFYRRTIGAEQQGISTPLFLGLVGGFSFLALWPLFFVLHFSGAETFEVPTWPIWLSIMLNSLLGTLLSEVLWLWATTLTSPVIATLALTLTIPIAVAADAIFGLARVKLTSRYIAGALLLSVCFFGLNLVDANPDTITRLKSKLFVSRLVI